jgi:HEPN domain-containing protein
MPNRAGDWLGQALRDLEHTRTSRVAGHHEWACFAAHPAAEKAVKAVHLKFGQGAWGQVVATLLAELPPAVSVPPDPVEMGRVLDNFYVPARYPNSHVEGAPLEHYGPLQSELALRHAGQIVEFARSQVA